MKNKDLETLSLGLCLMVFNFDLIVFTSVAVMGAFLVFQFANKYDNKSLKLFSIVSIVTIVSPFMLTKFANEPMILLLKVFLNVVSIYSLINVFKISIQILSEFYDTTLTEEKLSKDYKVIVAVDLVYVIIMVIPLLGYLLNMTVLTELSNLLIRPDIASSILFILLLFKYLFSKSYRNLNFKIRDSINNA